MEISGSSTHCHHFLNTVIAQRTIYAMHRKPIAITQSERGVGVAVVVFKDDKITDTKNTN